jgi:hypothetical protein
VHDGDEIGADFLSLLQPLHNARSASVPKTISLVRPNHEHISPNLDAQLKAACGVRKPHYHDRFARLAFSGERGGDQTHENIRVN